MSLVTPKTVEKLRKALHAKAKEEVGFRFYLLYDKVYRRDVLSHAYALSRAARGAPGVDGETFARIEEQGRERWLDELAEEMAAENVVWRLNRLLLGWGNYFHLGPVSKAYRAIDAHTCHRLRRWLCRKHKIGGQGTRRFPNEFLVSDLGLMRLSATTHNLPWAKA